MYHDRHAAVIVEFRHQQLALQAQQIINNTHPDLTTTNVLDMRTILNRSQSTPMHTPRYYADQHISASDPEISEKDAITVNYPANTYRLRHLPPFLSHDDLKYNLTYYGPITQLTEVENLPSTKREILITFDHHARISLLDNIWAVNIKGYNVPISKAHLTDSQLKVRNLHVAGFKDFNYRTTESQALRTF